MKVAKLFEDNQEKIKQLKNKIQQAKEMSKHRIYHYGFDELEKKRIQKLEDELNKLKRGK